MNFSSHKRGKTDLVATGLWAIFLASATLVSGCSSKDTGVASQGYKGVINLDSIRLGLPEEGAKGAPLTFVLDKNVTTPGMAQYLSRVYDKNNGQYCLIYQDGVPRQLRVVYAQVPISKEEALAKLKTILPGSTPEESKVDDSQLKSADKNALVELHYYGDAVKAEIIYSDKTAKTVKLVSVANILHKPGNNAKDAAKGTAKGDKVAGAEEKKTD